jgi:hypothetical protein
MNDMDPVHVAGNAVQTTLTYFDGQQRSVLALAIERQASAQPSLAERVSRPKTRAILGLMRLNFLSVFAFQFVCRGHLAKRATTDKGRNYAY